MVKMTTLFFLVAVLFGACTRNHSPFTPNTAPLHFNELHSIEALLETQPDAALDSLNLLKEQVQGKTVTPLDANELQLHEVQAHYKNRCLTEQSPDLAPVIIFYDSLVRLFPEDADLRYLLANTYYYEGVECAFADDDVEAFRHYLNALKQMKTREDWSDHPLRGDSPP